MYIPAWLLFFIGCGILALVNNHLKLRKQIRNLHGSLSVCNWVTDFTSRIELFAQGLNTYPAAQAEHKVFATEPRNPQLLAALESLDVDEVRQALQTISDFLNSTENPDLELYYVGSQSAEWYRAVLGEEKDVSYELIRNTYAYPSFRHSSRAGSDLSRDD